MLRLLLGLVGCAVFALDVLGDGNEVDVAVRVDDVGCLRLLIKHLHHCLGLLGIAKHLLDLARPLVFGYLLRAVFDYLLKLKVLLH